MRARTLLAVLPAALATVLVPAAHAAAFPSQTCAADTSATRLASEYTVVGTFPDKEYVFADANQSGRDLDICVRYQFRFGGGYNWDGYLVHIPGLVASATVSGGTDTGACTNVIASGVDPVPYRVATEQAGNQTSVCVTVASINLRITGTRTVSSPPSVDEDPTATGPGSLYDRAAQFPAGGSESSQCASDTQSGSSYLVTQNTSSFVRRNFAGSICFRSTRGTRGIGGRVDAFTIGVFEFATINNPSLCNTIVADNGQPPPLRLRVSTSAGFDPNSEGYVCFASGNNDVEYHHNPNGLPGVPTVKFDAP